MLIIAVVTIIAIEAWKGYGPLYKTSAFAIVLRSFAAPFLGLSVAALVQFAVKGTAVSRLLLFLSVVSAGAGLTGYRLILWAYFRDRLRNGYYAKNTVLIGLTPALEWVGRYFASEVSAREYHLLGYLKVRLDQADVKGAPALPCLGIVDQLGEILVHRPIDEVVVVQPESGCDWLAKIVTDCDYFRMPLSIIPESLLTQKLQDLSFDLQRTPLHLPAVVLRPDQASSEALFVKRLMDFSISAVLLVLLLPLFALIALAIKISDRRSQIFYAWRVVGLKGKEFTGYKFTTMVADADESKSLLLDKNEMSGPVFKIKNDPRVTKLGRVLRKYSLNELPQLWSVLKGDMSLVGPRPAFPHELARYELWHKRKLCIQPGITCLWQVRGRNRISNFDDWVRMDLEYIHKWSLLLDVRILVRTAWSVISGTGS
jgi:exopolysaccharide biosynthesis polyprenyl glycosylphosphotransferase